MLNDGKKLLQKKLKQKQLKLSNLVVKVANPNAFLPYILLASLFRQFLKQKTRKLQ